MKKLRMFEFQNGMVATFDESGQQVPLLQGKADEVFRTINDLRKVS